MQKETKYVHLRHAKIRLAKCTKTDLKTLLSDVLVQVSCSVFYVVITKTTKSLTPFPQALIEQRQSYQKFLTYIRLYSTP